MSSIGPVAGGIWKPFSRKLLDMGPSYYWRLGEKVGTVAVDQLDAAPGTYTNSPTLAVPGLLRGGDSGSGVLFASASSHKVGLGSVVDLTASAFTVLALVNTTSAPTRATIFGAASGGMEFQLYTGRPMLRCAAVSDSGTDAASTVSIGATALVAATYDLTTMYGWKDAVIGTAHPWTPAVTSGAKTTYIGVDPLTGDYFNGVIQEAAIFTRVLSQLEMTTLQNARTT